MKNLVAFFSSRKNDSFIHIAWLILLTILAFGILIPTLGFYWDDFPYLYQYVTFGPAGFPEYVSSDRPFSGWIFSITTALFGANPLGYHLTALVLRSLTSIFFYLIIRKLWPSKNFQVLSAASLFAVYPGFLQQPIALIYNHHLSVFSAFLLSIYFMVVSLEREKNRFVFFLISLILSLGMFSIENFAALELIRPLIIWVMLRKQKPRSIKNLLARSFIHWLPYALLFGVFLYWRIFIFKFPTYQPGFIELFANNPLDALLDLFNRIPGDFLHIAVTVWWDNLFFPTISKFGRTATILFWTLCLGSALAAILMAVRENFLVSKNTAVAKKRNHPASAHMVIGGILLFLLAGSILWVLELPLSTVFAWDRLTIAFIPAIALLFGGILGWLKKLQLISAVLLGVLVSAAIGTHFENTVAFKREWEKLNDFVFQLTWRAPSIEPETVLMGSKIDLTYYSDNSLTAPTNMVYEDALPDKQLAYYFFYTDARDRDWFFQKQYDLDIREPYRSFHFLGNTSNVVTIHYQPPGCLKIMDMKYSNAITTPNLSDQQIDEISFSNLSRISPEPRKEIPMDIFIQPQEASWCYYFQKADLYRQFSNYPQVTDIADQVISLGLEPRDASEWLPFLEGYLWEKEWEKAEDIVFRINQSEPKYWPGLCYTLTRIHDNPNYPEKSTLFNLIKENGCTIG